MKEMSIVTRVLVGVLLSIPTRTVDFFDDYIDVNNNEDYILEGTENKKVSDSDSDSEYEKIALEDYFPRLTLTPQKWVRETSLDRLYASFSEVTNVLLESHSSGLFNTMCLDTLCELLDEKYKPAYGVAALISLGSVIDRTKQNIRKKIDKRLTKKVKDTWYICPEDSHVVCDTLEKTGIKLLLEGTHIVSIRQAEKLLFAQTKISALTQWFEMLDAGYADDISFDKQLIAYFKPIFEKRANFFCQEETILHEERNADILERWHNTRLKTILVPLAKTV